MKVNATLYKEMMKGFGFQNLIDPVKIPQKGTSENEDFRPYVEKFSPPAGYNNTMKIKPNDSDQSLQDSETLPRAGWYGDDY